MFSLWQTFGLLNYTASELIAGRRNGKFISSKIAYSHTEKHTIHDFCLQHSYSYISLPPPAQIRQLLIDLGHCTGYPPLDQKLANSLIDYISESIPPPENDNTAADSCNSTATGIGGKLSLKAEVAKLLEQLPPIQQPSVEEASAQKPLFQQYSAQQQRLAPPLLTVPARQTRFSHDLHADSPGAYPISESAATEDDSGCTIKEEKENSERALGDAHTQLPCVLGGSTAAATIPATTTAEVTTTLPSLADIVTAFNNMGISPEPSKPSNSNPTVSMLQSMAEQLKERIRGEELAVECLRKEYVEAKKALD